MINHPLRRVTAIVLVLVIAGCGSSSGSYGSTKTPAAPAASAGGAVAPPPVAGLTIENSAFSDLSVAAGTEFTITNKDNRGHTVTDDSGAFNVSVAGGGTATLKIDKAGTYKIHCEIHSSMHGTITVA
jgi:plastocyanin